MRKGYQLWLSLVITLGLLTGCGKNSKYEMAANHMLEGNYRAAIEIYTELGDYGDSPMLRLECDYQLADQLLTSREYEEAISAFSVLGDYRDSQQKIQQCYFALGQEAFRQEQYGDAVDYFLQAGDSPDARTELDRAYYAFGHQLFVEGKYAAAQKRFDQIEVMPDDAQPHFQYLEDAREYLNEQADMLNEDISCLISYYPQLPWGDTLWDAVTNYVPFQYGSAEYDESEKTLKITATYYPGDRILYAWKTGEISALSEDETLALQKAEALVTEAKEHSDNPLAVELYLYNWLCEHIVYESPDMDVEKEAYLQLRQLNCLGALLDGKDNCQGYTDAFYLLGNMAGLDVCRIGGTGEWQPHSWNGIMLEGKRYIVDVTFGDVDDLGSSGKTYANFNCAYDPEVYTINGGTDVFPHLVMENDLSQSYYAYTDSAFTRLSDAADYLWQQYYTYGSGCVYAVVQDTELTNEELESSILDNSASTGVYSYQFRYMTQCYLGNTYIVVEWM